MAENGVRFVAGQWNAICDVCGQKYKSGDMKKRWDGLMVCPHDWEPRHPQDFLRAVPDRQAVPWSRPETTDVFVEGPACPYPTFGGIADYGTADCAQADVGFVVDESLIQPTEPYTGPFNPVTGVPEGDSLIDNNMVNNYDLNG